MDPVSPVTPPVPNEQPAASPQPSNDPAPANPTPQPEIPAQPAAPNVIQPTPVVPQSADVPASQPTLQNFSTPSPQVVQPVMSFNSQKKPRKSLPLIIGGALVIALLAGGTVFGYVLPNRPENVWNTGLNRSGKALNTLVSTASEKENLQKFTKSDVSATLTASIGKQSFSGNVVTKYDETGANGSLVVKSKSAEGVETSYNLDLIAQQLKDASYPTTHFRFKGLSDLGLEYLIPGIARFENKWITVDEQYLKTLGLDKLTAQKNSVSSADIAEIANAAMDVTQEYVFTTDPKLAVFERRSIVGKESVDGVSAFHYVVGLNMSNVASYCNALVDKVTATAAYKKLPFYDAATFDEDKKSAHKDCDEAKQDKNNEGKKTFDMWIDAKYKLVYKVRFIEDGNKEAYTDIGQLYKGGDDLHLFLKYHDGKSKTDGEINVRTNIKTSATSADILVQGNMESEPFSLKVLMIAKPFTGTVDTKAPDGAVKLEDVLKQLNIDPAMFGGSALGGDTKSQTTY